MEGHLRDPIGGRPPPGPRFPWKREPLPDRGL